MEIICKSDGGRLTAFLNGEIDHHNSEAVRTKIDIDIEKYHPEELILDFKDVTFMDSSGIGLVIGRCKVMKSIGGRVIIDNAAVQTKKVMKLAGLDMLTTIC